MRDMPEDFPHKVRPIVKGRADGRLEKAQTIGLQALTFLLSEPTHLVRFLSETGMAPAQLRANAQAPEVLEAALTVLSNDEPLLLTFAANTGLAPEDVVRAHADLATNGGEMQPTDMT